MVRIKHRYLLLNILYPDASSVNLVDNTPDFLKFHAPTPQHVTSHVFLAHLRSHIADLFGDQGLGLCQSSLKLLYFSNATSTAILRVPRTHHQLVWATLSYMSTMPASKDSRAPGKKCVIRVVRVSGTIRKAEDELLRRSRRQVVEARVAGMDSQDAVLKKFIGGDNPLSVLPDVQRDSLSAGEDLAGMSSSE